MMIMISRISGQSNLMVFLIFEIPVLMSWLEKNLKNNNKWDPDNRCQRTETVNHHHQHHHAHIQVMRYSGSIELPRYGLMLTVLYI